MREQNGDGWMTLVLILLMALLVVGGLAGFALLQRSRVIQQERLAMEQALRAREQARLAAKQAEKAELIAIEMTPQLRTAREAANSRLLAQQEAMRMEEDAEGARSVISQRQIVQQSAQETKLAIDQLNKDLELAQHAAEAEKQQRLRAEGYVVEERKRFHELQAELEIVKMELAAEKAKRALP